jgi:cell division protein FtsQ
MRSVKARDAPSEKAAASGRRGKILSRAPEPRVDSRAQRKAKRGVACGTRAERGSRFAIRRPILALTLIVIVAGGAIGLFAGGHVAKAVGRMEAAMVAPFTDAGFAVRDITLVGEERTAADAAYAALAIGKGGSIFSVRPDEARARLLMLPWVADAEVRRHFPDSVSVRIVEKRPFALWRNGKEVSIVERSGAVITMAGTDRFAHLPLIAGPGAPEAAAPIIDALAGQKAIQARLQAIERIGERRWDLLLSGGVTVRLPEEGWERQLSELEQLIVEKGVLERDIEVIDLRYPDSYVFRLHNGDSRPVPRERRA